MGLGGGGGGGEMGKYLLICIEYGLKADPECFSSFLLLVSYFSMSLCSLGNVEILHIQTVSKQYLPVIVNVRLKITQKKVFIRS